MGEIIPNHKLLMDILMPRRTSSQSLKNSPSKGEVQSQKIVKSAMSVLGQSGLIAFSIDAVEKKAKIKRSLLTYYFPNLDSLIFAAINQMVLEGQHYSVHKMTKVQNGQNILRLDEYIRGTYEWMFQFPSHARILMALIYLASVDDRYKAIQERVEHDSVLRFAEMLRMVQKKHVVDVKIMESSRQLRKILIGDLVWYIQHALYEDPKEYIKGTLKVMGAYLKI